MLQGLSSAAVRVPVSTQKLFSNFKTRDSWEMKVRTAGTFV